MTTLQNDLQTVKNGLIALERVINQLTIKTEELERKAGITNTISVPNRLVETQPIKKDGYTIYPKDVELLSQLLEVTTNEKTKNFLLNIANNDYTTITQGQKDAIDKIAEQSLETV